MRKILLGGTAAIALVIAESAHAQFGGLCTTVTGPCASTPNQILEYARQLLQLNQETETAIQEVTNTLNLGATAFTDLTGEIQQILTIASQANMLINLTGQIITNINTAGGYPIGYGTASQNWHQQMARESNAVGNAMKTAGQALNALQNLGNDAAALANLVTQIMAVVGRQQSLQTLQSSLSTLAQTLQRTQATQTTNQQAALTYFAAQQDRQYLIQTVADHDNEASWLNECQTVAELGFVPNGCQGAYAAGSQADQIAVGGGGAIGPQTDAGIE